MSLRTYLTSRVFFGQAFVAIVILAVLSYLFMHWLTFTTDHGHEITVPNLAKLTEEQVEDKLDELNLDYVLLDSVDYKTFAIHTLIDKRDKIRWLGKDKANVYDGNSVLDKQTLNNWNIKR